MRTPRVEFDSKVHCQGPYPQSPLGDITVTIAYFFKSLLIRSDQIIGRERAYKFKVGTYLHQRNAYA